MNNDRKITFVAARFVTIQQATQLHLHVRWRWTLFWESILPHWYSDCIHWENWVQWMYTVFMYVTSKQSSVLRTMNGPLHESWYRWINIQEQRKSYSDRQFSCLEMCWKLTLQGTIIWGVETGLEWDTGDRVCLLKEAKWILTFFQHYFVAVTNTALTPSIKLDWQCACSHSWLAVVCIEVYMLQWGQVSGQDARWLMLNHSFVKFFFFERKELHWSATRALSVSSL